MASAASSLTLCLRINALGTALVAAFLGIAGCSGGAKPQTARSAGAVETVDQRILEYRRSLESHPRLWAVRANLGRAYLEKARETADPKWLAMSEQELQRSLAIQPNLPAWIGRAALANYRHRFEEALTWVDLVQKTAPERSDIRAIAVEAYLELGRHSEAERLLPAKPLNFTDAATLAKWSLSRKSPDEAVRYFEVASRLSPEKQYQAWALVRAAGVYLDSGRSDQAVPYLERAAQLAPQDRELKIHRAEWMEAQGRPEEALAVYEGLLQEREQPMLHDRAWALARRLGRQEEAQRHYRAAEAGYQHAIDLGEIYTIEPLERLRSGKAASL